MVRSPFFVLLIFFCFISCVETAKEKANQSPETGGFKTEARRLLGLGDYYYDTVKKFDRAYHYYRRSKGLYELEKDSANVAYNLLQMASCQQTFGDYVESEVILTEAESYIITIKDLELKSQYTTYLNTLYGVSFKELSNYDDALQFYKQARKKTNDPVAKIALDNNIAAVYIQKNEYSTAIKILEKILKSKVLDTLEKRRALYLDNLGFAYSKAKEGAKGLDLMKEALVIKIKVKDSYGIIESYLHLSEYYQDKDLNKSKDNALKAYEWATDKNSIDERLEALEFLMAHNDGKGKNKYAIQFIHLNDSIKKIRVKAKNQFAKFKYDTREIKEQNLVLKAQKAEDSLQFERQKNQKYFFLSAFLLLIGAIAYLINYFKNKNREAVYKTETRISKKLHDELANDVYHTMTFAETQDLEIPEKREALIDNLDKIYARTRNISAENSEITTGDKFESNLKEMLSSYNSDKVKVIIKDNNEVNWIKVSSEKKIATYRVLQELLVNMKKHSQCTLAVVGFEGSENSIKINYSDNGIGADDKLLSKNGLQNVENRIHSIKGTITFESETSKGFKVKISFPK
ncbi:tetratricopeptide repeat-containing sensor histidine kinase [Flavobacterium sp.]|uniref:tetratricopeptide repeat-containing sensor histidine kinase n=1 Tax=Flavobacterium sp. TaxID=239 RepID=UPI003D6A46A3